MSNTIDILLTASRGVKLTKTPERTLSSSVRWPLHFPMKDQPQYVNDLGKGNIKGADQKKKLESHTER